MNVAEYLDSLGIAEDEMVGMLWIRGDHKQTAVMPRDAVESFSETVGPEFNAYLSPNPTAGPTRVNKGRGTEEQVTRVAAVYADLDVKLGACPSIESAWAIIDTVSARIAERPSVVIFSGGGLQPIWALEHCEPSVGIPLLRRFGRLVRAIGQVDGIKLDSVFDAARVLRIPGSLNHKYGDPITVTAELGTGAPMDPATLAERLDEWGIFEEDGDDKTGLGEVVVAETGWRFAVESCGYSVTAIKAWWAEPVTERHPWLLGCLVRLECMRRNGCLSRDDYERGLKMLKNRFAKLLITQEPKRQAKRYEISELHNVAVDRASRKGQAELDSELGGKNGHVHLTGAARALTPSVEPETPAAGGSTPGIANLVELERGFWDSRESLQTIYTAALGRMCSPWAVLACCVARALATVRPNCALPPVIGGRGSLNWFGAIAGNSGDGKGAAFAVARELVSESVYTRKPGSGEGIIKAFKGKDGARESIMFNANEVSAIAALGQRSGSTLMATLCEAFSGEELGFGYAGDGKDFHVQAHAYRMTFLCAVQPGRAHAILNDVDAGTPQRFMWFPATDGRITKAAKREFKSMQFGLELPPPHTWQHDIEIILPEGVEDFIETNHERRRTGNGSAIDGHSVFAREKFAYALTVLDGRWQMSSEDWELSGIASSVSDATRDWVASGMADAARAEAAGVGELLGHRNAAARSSEAEVVTRKTERLMSKVLSRLAESDCGLTDRELRNSAASRDRAMLVDRVLPELDAQGLITAATGDKGGRLWTLASKQSDV